MSRHEILGGLVQLYRRDKSRFWQCSASVDGKQHRDSTEEEDLVLAKVFAEDWYLELRGKARAGILKSDKTFAQVAKVFQEEYPIITKGQRSQKWVEGHNIRLRLHLLPYFGQLAISDVTTGKVAEYRAWRADPKNLKPLYKEDGVTLAKKQPKVPSRSTLHDEIGTLRLVLQCANRNNWLLQLPQLSSPYRAHGKISHRAWFTPEEYKSLYGASRAYAEEPFQSQIKWHAEQVHDFILFMGNTGLRPDEAGQIEHRDVSIVKDEDTGEKILHIEVRGKRGVGFCKSMPGAVLPYQRLLKRPKPGLFMGRRARKRRGEDPDSPVIKQEIRLPEPTDKVFPGSHVKLFNNLLVRNNLKLDRDGNPRTAYSLRHTYICMRLMDGADIYALAKNCRTSVEMIQKFYAAHLKTSINAADVNVRRKKSRRKSGNSDD